MVELKSDFHVKHLYVVGHSFGASLVPRIAMDFPEVVDGVVVIAGDLSDEYPAAHWYNQLADWRAVSWILPGDMKKANREVMALNPSLGKMMPLWSDLHVPVMVIQGEKDGLVDPRHADFAEALQTKDLVKVERFPDAGHLVHLTHSDEVNALLLDFFQSVSGG